MWERSANSSEYRYGFNGQEKDDEVAGEANSYTAEFWQYDPRVARRWNQDPKPNPSISNYATFANNPIIFTDFLGDTIKFADGSTREFIDKTNSYINEMRSTEEGMKVISQLEKSANIFTIEQVDGILKSQFEPLLDENDNMTGDGIIRLGLGNTKVDGVYTNGLYAFAHEAFHGFQLSLGTSSYKMMYETKGENGYTNMLEIQAVGFENYIRGSLNQEGYNTPRLHYTTRSTYAGQTAAVMQPLLEYTKNNWGNWLLNGSDDWDMNDFLNIRKAGWINMQKQTYMNHHGLDGVTGAN